MESRVVEISLLQDSTFNLEQLVTSHEKDLKNISSLQGQHDETISKNTGDVLLNKLSVLIYEGL